MAKVVYHWKHGWIPLDHTAALAKAKGNHERAAELLRAAQTEHGIRSRADLRGALHDLPNVPEHHKAEAREQVKKAASEHGVTLPSLREERQGDDATVEASGRRRLLNVPQNVAAYDGPSGDIRIESPYNEEFVAGVKKLGGKWDRADKAWSIPSGRADELQALITSAYGERASNGSSITHLTDMPDKVSLTRQGSTLIAKTPYSNEFRQDAKKLGGRWDPERKAWVFNAGREAAVAAAVIKHFGTPSRPRTGASRSGKASEKQLDYAMSLLNKLGPQGWHDTDIGQGFTMPTRATLATWDARDVSDLITELKDAWR